MATRSSTLSSLGVAPLPRCCEDTLCGSLAVVQDDPGIWLRPDTQNCNRLVYQFCAVLGNLRTAVHG
eukprot:7915743-Lingulodinium_polyedra.AAC.1